MASPDDFRYFLGGMSGTSADGVDVALIKLFATVDTPGVPLEEERRGDGERGGDGERRGEGERRGDGERGGVASEAESRGEDRTSCRVSTGDPRVPSATSSSLECREERVHVDRGPSITSPSSGSPRHNRWSKVQYTVMDHAFVAFPDFLRTAIFGLRSGNFDFFTPENIEAYNTAEAEATPLPSGSERDADSSAPIAVRTRARTTAISPANVLGAISWVGRQVSLLYVQAAQVVLQRQCATLNAKDVTAYGVHGQTIFHDPPETWQLIDPTMIATRLGIPVVFDFRRADCAAGGQGAPLVPFLDYITFKPGNDALLRGGQDVAAVEHSATSGAPCSSSLGRVLVNLGGIANITVIPPGGRQDLTIAFDTGPANCLSDYVMRLRTSLPFDEGGHLAAVGKVIEHVVEQFLEDPYFAKPAPKSTDVSQMIARFVHVCGENNLPTEDLLATCCYIVAKSLAAGISAAVVQSSNASASRWEIFCSGGGTSNAFLMEAVKGELATAFASSGAAVLGGVGMSDDFGLPSQSKEAVAFAMLAAAYCDRVPANLPSCTGAARAVICGCLAPVP